MRHTNIFKSFTAILLAMVLTLGLVGCGNDKEDQQEVSLNSAYNNQINSLTSAIAGYGDTVAKTDSQNMKIDMDLSVELSDSLHSLLRSYTSYDLKWINEAKISISESFKDNVMSLALGLVYAQTELVKAEAIMDFAGGQVFLGVPALNNEYLHSSFGSEFDMSSLDGIKDIAKLVPDSQTLAKLIKEICDTVMNSMGDIQGEKTELKVNGVKQSCIAYEVKLSQKDIVQIAVDLMEMLRDSEDLKKIVVDLVNAANELSETMNGFSDEVSSDEAYQEMMDSIDESIEALNEQIKFNTLSEDIILVWTSYVTADNKIAGVEFDYSDYGNITTLYFATARNNNDVGTQIYVKEDGYKLFEINGELEDNGKKISGTYEIGIDGESIAFVDIENVDAQKLKSGYFVGSISISPSKGLINMITDEIDVDFSMAGLAIASLALRVDVEKNDGKEIKAAISIMNGSEPYVAVKLQGKIAESGKIQLPQDYTDDPEEWASDIKLDKLIDNVSKSGIPNYVAELLQTLKYAMQYN